MILVPVAAGELADKISILRIKAARIADEGKLLNVRRELAALEAVAAEALPPGDALAAVRADLQAVNERLWDVEDAIRDHERRGDFGPAFVALARAVYVTNDRRAALKREVDRLTGSQLTEEKSYKPYGPA